MQPHITGQALTHIFNVYNEVVADILSTLVRDIGTLDSNVETVVLFEVRGPSPLCVSHSSLLFGVASTPWTSPIPSQVQVEGSGL
jgi:hypothetical protein